MMDACKCKDEMLQEVMALDFAVHDLVLYLDTHPEDCKALALWQQYCNEYKTSKDKYQKVYGPLTAEFPCEKYRWIEGPWPWEGGY